MLQIPIVNTKKSNPSLPAMNLKFNRQPEEVESRVTNPSTLNDLIRQLPGVPRRTAVLGLTSEGIPLLFNLADARPGSVLVVADRSSQKTSLMKVLATSLAQHNRPEEVRFAVITGNPEEWIELETRFPSHFMKITANVGSESEDLIYHLCDLVEARQNGMHAGTAYVLLFDGLSSTAHMDVDLRANVEWLVRCGARQQIWTVAALECREFLTMNLTAELFKTRIVGQVSDPQIAARLMPPRFHNPGAGDMRPLFTVRIHQHWMQFSLPVSLV